jgi:hypothetical protein
MNIIDSILLSRKSITYSNTELNIVSRVVRGHSLHGAYLAASVLGEVQQCRMRGISVLRLPVQAERAPTA